jgi:uncharacterized membrane protein
VALAIIVLAIVRAARGRSFKPAIGLVVGSVILAVLLTSVAAGLVFVRPEERGVVISAAVPQKKDLVGQIEKLAWDRFLAHRQAEFAGQQELKKAREELRREGKKWHARNKQ